MRYKNRYGDIFTFEVNERGNIDWKGNFEYCSFSYVDDPDDLIMIDPSGGPYIDIGFNMGQFGLVGKVAGFIPQEYGYELVIEPCDVCGGKTHHKLTCQNNPNKQHKVLSPKELDKLASLPPTHPSHKKDRRYKRLTNK